MQCHCDVLPLTECRPLLEYSCLRWSGTLWHDQKNLRGPDHSPHSLCSIHTDPYSTSSFPSQSPHMCCVLCLRTSSWSLFTWLSARSLRVTFTSPSLIHVPLHLFFMDLSLERLPWHCVLFVYCISAPQTISPMKGRDHFGVFPAVSLLLMQSCLTVRDDINDSFMKRDWTASVVFISLGSLPSENLMIAIVPSLEPDIYTHKPRLISGQDFDHRWKVSGLDWLKVPSDTVILWAYSQLLQVELYEWLNALCLKCIICLII